MGSATPTENKDPTKESIAPRDAAPSESPGPDFALRALHEPLARVTLCAATLSGLLGGLEWGLGVALGALLFAINLKWMDRHFAMLIAHARQQGLEEQRLADTQTSPQGDPPGPAISQTMDAAGPVQQAQKSPTAATGLTLRLPMVALALGGILWYMPARLEGVALGVALVPMTLAWVGIRHQKRNAEAQAQAKASEAEAIADPEVPTSGTGSAD